jgi:hypothetical protein
MIPLLSRMSLLHGGGFQQTPPDPWNFDVELKVRIMFWANCVQQIDASPGCHCCTVVAFSKHRQIPGTLM